MINPWILVLVGVTTKVAFAALPAGNEKSAPQPQASSQAQSGIEAVLSEEMISGLRDPFQVPAIIVSKKESPRAELELTQLKDIRLNGVVTGPKRTRALLSVPNGKTFFVSIGDRVGVRGGKVTGIKTGKVSIVEFDTDLNGKRVQERYELSIDGELVSLSDLD
jgi:hypothetical protein